MRRADISEFLIHWTSGNSYEEAFNVLYNILISKEIMGSTKNIKGGYTCVCFTETPAKYFSFHKRTYKPFGIGITKKYLYSEGGRPVIYESDKEFYLLPEDIKWRHVLYDPCLKEPRDFTWEREWRIKRDEVYLHHEEVIIIVPDISWEEELINRFDYEESIRYRWECIGYGEDLASYPEPFLYKIVDIDNFESQ